MLVKLVLKGLLSEWVHCKFNNLNHLIILPFYGAIKLKLQFICKLPLLQNSKYLPFVHIEWYLIKQSMFWMNQHFQTTYETQNKFLMCQSIMVKKRQKVSEWLKGRTKFELFFILFRHFRIFQFYLRGFYVKFEKNIIG